MKTADKYKYWAMLCDYDMDTAQVLIEGKRWVYVAYMCHQALERQLKGMYVYYLNKEAPKTHNLPFLFDKLQNTPGFPECGALAPEKSVQMEDFFTEVMFYYMSDYPFSYKRVTSRFIDEATGRQLFGQVCDCIQELRALQPLPELVDIEEERQNGKKTF